MPPRKYLATGLAALLLLANLLIIFSGSASAAGQRQSSTPTPPVPPLESPAGRPLPPVSRATTAGAVQNERPTPRVSQPGVAPLPAPTPTPRSSYAINRPIRFPTSGKWIDVDLSRQRVTAYNGRTPVRQFIVSTGLPGTPTVTGTFRIYLKTPLQDMEGGNLAAGNYYRLKDVAWVQYFYKEYSLHAAYWHNNFGHPMSHGCVNMREEDAKWLFEWASPYIDPAITIEHWVRTSGQNLGAFVVVHE